ncbi:uncharacterized protein LACBIDRAFT_316656 [Laccaria bicolor S238N-H82]|uniref:Predicted protein n=1 Tax=Laccaria bicolor (strain S238N-H82 / ATCC MYA-4686) TaxID=486041 RepID=B0E1C9_LACBS|nr:uncharacterized protein LACBIDRAFT_316656 [Laccaria bicolor S238N-H82]EDQ99344.1 predicted protein [Laccaria bicolor S238N-H82]|eukprot:XP_001889990.1 predicted protein [Laccaria bicolor S238N-H82]
MDSLWVSPVVDLVLFAAVKDTARLGMVCGRLLLVLWVFAGCSSGDHFGLQRSQIQLWRNAQMTATSRRTTAH